MRMTQCFLKSTLVGAVACLALAAHSQGVTAPSPAVPPASIRQADFIVAVVNSEPITNHEVQSRIARIQQQASQQGGRPPPRDELARQVLDRLIVERAQIQLAREVGVRVDDAAIDLAEQNVARQNRVDTAELRLRLKRDGIPVAQFRGEIRDQILLSRLREREVDAKVKVSDVEAEQFLREQELASTSAPTEINLAQILVSVREDATPEQVAARKVRAEEVLKRARAGEDFAALAIAFSDAPERAGGGELGLRSPDRYPSLFVDTVVPLRTGGISELVRSGAGWHILKVLEKRQSGIAGMSVTQNHARHILLRLGPQLTEADARERLTDMKRRIESGQADFASLARASSQDGSAPQGGDLGWSNPGQFVPEFEEALDGMRPGDLSDPLVSRFGVHLIQLIERRQYALNPREQREMARGLVREKKVEEAYVDWLQDVRARAYVELREPPQ